MVKEKIQMTDDGFIEVYESQVKQARTYTQAYENTETMHEITFGHRRYSSYHSFEVVKNRKRKN